MTHSEQISNFLKFLRETKEEYDIASSTRIDKENETQDILHRLELRDDKYGDVAKPGKTLRNIRRERRDSKDTVAITSPIAAWYRDNQKEIKSLERLLGEVRKEESKTEGRVYTDKTDIIQKTLGEEHE